MATASQSSASESVTFVLPLTSEASNIEPRVTTIVEELGELTRDFEVILIDHDASDACYDTATDLTRVFPQVRLMQHRAGRLYDAIELALRAATGDTLFVHDVAQPLTASSIHQLWAMRNDDELVVAQSPQERRRINDSASSDEAGSLQMIRRLAIKELMRQHSTSEQTHAEHTGAEHADAVASMEEDAALNDLRIDVPQQEIERAVDAAIEQTIDTPQQASLNQLPKLIQRLNYLANRSWK